MGSYNQALFGVLFCWLRFIDKYNKAIYLVLENKLKIPVKPSARGQLPIVDYNEQKTKLFKCIKERFIRFRKYHLDTKL